MTPDRLAKLHQWIDARHTHASSLFQVAEQTREAGDYSDLEALEQSIYNQAVLDTLTELRGLLAEDERGE